MKNNLFIIALFGTMAFTTPFGLFGLMCQRGTIASVINRTDDVYYVSTAAKPEVRVPLLPRWGNASNPRFTGTDRYLTLTETGEIIIESPLAFNGAGVRITINCQENMLSAIATALNDEKESGIRKGQAISEILINLNKALEIANNKAGIRKDTSRWHAVLTLTLPQENRIMAFSEFVVEPGNLPSETAIVFTAAELKKIIE